MRMKGLARVMGLLCAATSFAAIEKSMIDFSTYQDTMGGVVDKSTQIYDEVTQGNPDLDPTAWGYPALRFTAEDWALEEWKIQFLGSSDRWESVLWSETKAVPSQRFGTVLGARIRFPDWQYAGAALVKPPFSFFQFYADGTLVSRDGDDDNAISAGVLYNVGRLKSLAAWVYGLNYPHEVSLRVSDRDGRVQQFKLGSTLYDGWRRLFWANTEYTDNYRLLSMVRTPLYPKVFPYLKFESFVVHKPYQVEGGDYVVYFKDVVFQFDRAIQGFQNDIDDEAAWGIIARERQIASAQQMRRAAEQLTLRNNAQSAATENTGQQQGGAPADQQAAGQQAAGQQPAGQPQQAPPAPANP